VTLRAPSFRRFALIELAIWRSQSRAKALTSMRPA